MENYHNSKTLFYNKKINKSEFQLIRAFKNTYTNLHLRFILFNILLYFNPFW